MKKDLASRAGRLVIQAGGHFAVIEQPRLLADDIKEFFKLLVDNLESTESVMMA